MTINMTKYYETLKKFEELVEGLSELREELGEELFLSQGEISEIGNVIGTLQGNAWRLRRDVPEVEADVERGYCELKLFENLSGRKRLVRK